MGNWKKSAAKMAKEIEIPASWSFSAVQEKKFLRHIKKSVPNFEDSHKLVCSLSTFFLRKKAKHVDLGCSFGILSLRIQREINNPNCLSIGIDEQKHMINCAKAHAKKSGLNKKCRFKASKIESFAEKNVDLITCLYTLQFINPKYRQDVVNNIYKSLNWGGGLILFEKVRGPDARFQDILTTLYNEFKESKGISSKQILLKTKSLKGVLEPFSEAGNIGILKRAGFKDIMTISRNLCFHGWLCIK